TPDDLIFGGHSKTPEDTLDFIMWKHLADKLGIKLTDADLMREINREAAFDVFDPDKTELEKSAKITTFFRRGDFANVSVKDFSGALRAEFGVVMAQSILLGYEPGARSYRSRIDSNASPAAVSPEEFLPYSRNNPTAVKVALLAVPAEKYLAQVEA